jgi:hypothetical protein
VQDGFDLGRAEFREAGVDLRRAGEDVAGFEIIFTAVEAADDATRFADEQASCREIPGRQAGFPEAVEPPGRDVAEIQRGCARAPYAGRVLDDLAQHLQVGFHLDVGVAERKPGAYQRPLEITLPADANAAAVELGAGAARGGEEFLAHGIVDDAVLHPAVHLHANRNREHGETVQEVGGAVERIDDPDRIRVAARARLLGEDGVVRVVLVDRLYDFPFRRPVRFADVIVAAFLLHGQAVELDEVPHQRVAGAPRGHHGHIQ